MITLGRKVFISKYLIPITSMNLFKKISKRKNKYFLFIN